MPDHTNITLAIVGNYCSFQRLILNASLVTNWIYSVEESRQQALLDSAFTYFPDAAIAAAVEIVNASSDILPNVTVNIKRFSDCGAWYPNVLNDYGGASGGWASSVLYEDLVERHTDVIGIVSDEFSTTTVGPAQQMSLKRIPFCSGSAGSPRLSNRDKFPYFWRTLTALGVGEHVYQVLKYWNVSQVAIIYQSDDELGSQSAIDITRSIRTYGINIIVNIGLRSDVNKNDVNNVAKALSVTTARYFILSGQSTFQSQIYEGLASFGFVSSAHVWMSYVPIDVTDPALQQGFILLQQPLPDQTTFQFTRFYEDYNRISGINDSMSEYDVAIYVAPFFDCAMMMMIGFDQVLKVIPGATPTMLAERKLQEHMSYELFQNLGYSGLIENPVVLNEYGDLAS
ncbi:periplasmic binding protein-like I [Chytriomyces sp. MP71]|nr:periplasmic binding protein-like I [Chytriomyces sp. MP71]